MARPPTMTALPPELLQFAGSLAAILLLALVAHGLKLGGAPRLADEAAIREACDHAVPGFDPVALAQDAGGAGAIALDKEGRVLVLRGHGARLAGRLLTPAAQAEKRDGALVIDTGERRFGTVRLDLADPSAWIQAIAAIGRTSHA